MSVHAKTKTVKGRAEAARERLLESGWQASPPTGGSFLRFELADEPRVALATGETKAGRSIAQAYSSESELLIRWTSKQLSLNLTTFWNETPGDSPILEGDPDDSWLIQDIFRLAAPANLETTRRWSGRGFRRKPGLAEVLGTALSDLRLQVGNSQFTDSNEDLDEPLLRTFHQLLYVRILEDRNRRLGTSIDEIREMQDSDIMPALGETLAHYRRDYNSDLFRETELNLGLAGGHAIKPVLDALVEPWRELKLDFSLTRADLAGRLYQQYLKKAPVRRKPGPQFEMFQTVERDNEQQKAAAYYTPTPVAASLAARVIRRWVDSSPDHSADNIRVVDPACGSGSFLIAAYRQIASIREHKHGPLRPVDRERIIRECIFGADIDSKAIGITQVQLLEVAKLGKKRLPELSENLWIGDSLAAPPSSDSQVPTAVPWKEALNAGGPFDVVLTNPPFHAQKKLAQRMSEKARMELRERFPEVRDWGSDLAYYFVPLALELTGENSSLGFVLPNSVLDGRARKLREFIAGNRLPASIIDFRGYRLFSQASAYVSFLELGAGDDSGSVEVEFPNRKELDLGILMERLERNDPPFRKADVPKALLAPTAARNWSPFFLRWTHFRDQWLDSGFTSFGATDAISVTQGTQSGDLKRFTVSNGRWEAAGGGKVRVDGLAVDDRFVPLLARSEYIRPFLPPPIGDRHLLPVEDDKSIPRGPEIEALIDAFGPRAKNFQPGAVQLLRKRKAILGGFAKEPSAFADFEGAWTTVKGTAGGICVVPTDQSHSSTASLTALLMSSLFQWLLQGLGRPRGDGTTEFLVSHVNELPYSPDLDWTALSTSYERVTKALGIPDSGERYVAFHAARRDLDDLVMDGFGASQDLRALVNEELERDT